MDIAKVFAVLSQGRIISLNSSEMKEEALFLANENNFEEVNNIVRQIGYNLIGTDGYYYISKRDHMNSKERVAFIRDHKDIILAISIIRLLHPRKDRGNPVSFMETAAEYEAYKRNDPSIYEKLKRLSSSKNSQNEKFMLENMFSLLEKHGVFEKTESSNDNDYKILNSIEYYISIVEKVQG